MITALQNRWFCSAILLIYADREGLLKFTGAVALFGSTPRRYPQLENDTEKKFQQLHLFIALSMQEYF